LNQRERARIERERRTLAALAELGVTPAEASLFHVVNYGMALQPSSLCGVAAEEYYRFPGVTTELECQAALDACLNKGWLQLIDEPALGRITEDLKAGTFIGPVYGLPEVGGIDFTPVGAALWMKFLQQRSRDTTRIPFAYTDVVHEKTARYFQSHETAVAEIKEASAEDDVVSIDGPTSIGPWRAQWWRRFPEGYRIDIEQRRQWKGHASGVGEECSLHRHPEKSNSQRLKNILDRHNVTFAEWIVLAALNRGPKSFDQKRLRWLVEEANREFGFTVSESVFQDGLEACLKNGWVRVLNQQILDEIRAWLREDPTVLAVPRIARLEPHACCYRPDPHQPDRLIPEPTPDDHIYGEIDFAPSGANLYRMISAEWLGPDWEDHLRVANGYYREEHRYCESEGGFRDIVPEYQARGENVQAVRVVPLGPWCVSWWERFPNGFRLEIEVGSLV
jgi:hypothetical protein